MSSEQIGGLIPLGAMVVLYLWGEYKNIGWVQRVAAAFFMIIGGYLLLHWHEMAQ